MSVPPGPATPRLRAQLTVWWALWAVSLATLGLLSALVGRPPPVPPPAVSLANLAGMVPLFISIIIRWLVLPRSRAPGRPLGLFIVGLALAETGGVLGLFGGGPYRDELVLLGVLGLAQYVPLFARGLVAPPPDSFFPNN
jgi:hypothetical protein